VLGGAPESPQRRKRRDPSRVFVPAGQPLGTLLHDGYRWWLDFQSNNLERVPLAGGTRERLVEVHFGGPIAGDANAVYWGDTSLNTIEKWSPATGRVRLSDADPNGIVVADGTIYWTNGFIGGSVRSVRTDGTGHRTLLCGLQSRSAHRRGQLPSTPCAMAQYVPRSERGRAFSTLVHLLLRIDSCCECAWAWMVIYRV
jgi:hypothetical protein